ncbi:hypothetical protein [Chromohalobacter sp. 296-RDG]|uniref:hypothetical protein n=1 Tax=Chromohalobacter sp. 296-RDG TaxID=2994062 RepID=UPI0024685D1E|nr:hypothetical protein [Chromohalobacter sp. 296-RDG]
MAPHTLPPSLTELLEVSGIALTIADGEQPGYPLIFVNHSSLERAYSTWLVHQPARTAQRFQACHMAVTVSINVTRDQVESGQLAEDMVQARKRHALAVPQCGGHGNSPIP